jgi:hypothetical protein
VLTKGRLAKATGVYILKIPHNSCSEKKTGSSAEIRNWHPTGEDLIVARCKIMLGNVQ